MTCQWRINRGRKRDNISDPEQLYLALVVESQHRPSRTRGARLCRGPRSDTNIQRRAQSPLYHGIIKETLRMRPINKFRNNHYSIEIPLVQRLLHPKNTIVIANWWAIHYDPNVYPHPERFLPERRLDYPYSSKLRLFATRLSHLRWSETDLYRHVSGGGEPLHQCHKAVVGVRPRSCEGRE